MTLINYLTRVHFADGVLEEALRSEMERNDKRRPLIISEEAHLTGAMFERFLSSLPIRVRAECFSAVPARATEAAARRIARIYRDEACDLLIAYGSNRAMDLAKVARIAIAYDEPIAALSAEEGGAQRITNDLPDLYSIPGILGFASAMTDYTRVKPDAGGQVLLSSPHLIPEVAICDPTLTLGATPEDSACAAAGILARAVDAYLAPGYNPPAESMALDALRRAVGNVEGVVFRDELCARREMMASGLNSSLALQKGLCAVHAISNAVASVARQPVDPSTLGGILIPHLAQSYAGHGCARMSAVRQSLSVPDGEDLGLGLLRILNRLPVARSFDDLGIVPSDLPRAARLALGDRAIGNAPLLLDFDAVMGILHSAQNNPAIRETAAE